MTREWIVAEMQDVKSANEYVEITFELLAPDAEFCKVTVSREFLTKIKFQRCQRFKEEYIEKLKSASVNESISVATA